MGKGDRRSKRGKIWRGTSGKTRPKKKGRQQRPPQPDERAKKFQAVMEEVAAKKEAH